MSATKVSEATPLLTDTDANNATNLSKFRRAIGINVDDKSDDLEAARKTARGMYKEVINIQLWRNRQYHFVEGIFYLTLGTQIVIGACLAALGPLSSDHGKAITILGVINSSLAGVLALLKGQNLPDRLRKDGFEMKKVQDYIEETEIRLQTLEGDPQDFTGDELDAVLQTVFARYNSARDTAEMNRPDSYAHQGVAEIDKRVKDMGTRRNLVPSNGKGKDKDVHYEIS